MSQVIYCLKFKAEFVLVKTESTLVVDSIHCYKLASCYAVNRESVCNKFDNHLFAAT